MRTFYLSGGGTSLHDDRIGATVILGVKLEGIGLDEVSSSPGFRQFVYAIDGTLSFGLPIDNQKLIVICI